MKVIIGFLAIVLTIAGSFYAYSNLGNAQNADSIQTSLDTPKKSL